MQPSAVSNTPTTPTKEQIMASSPTAWALMNKLVTENQYPIEFTSHRFLIDLYEDMHPDIVVRKSAQVGESVERILKAFWCCNYLGANVIYVLPTNNVIKDFVTPKVNPLITSNPPIQAMVSRDSEGLKQIGQRFLYFKGAFSERDAIAISGDILILDELDRMPSMQVVNTYDSRLQASKFGYRWRLSNPSQVGYGVDGLFQDSNQYHWFMKCTRCNFESFIDYSPNQYPELANHYIDEPSQQYVCGKCQKPLVHGVRQNGRWVARYPTRYRHGYWINQLMAPWVTAKRIMEQKAESTPDFFHNYVLGKAYTPSDILVNRESILRACAPSRIEKIGVVIGVDQNVNEQIWVAGTAQGIFAHGRTKSWEEFENLKLMWNATVVSDPMPYPTKPKQLADKYPDFYMCRFKQMQGLGLVEWKGSMVYVDRTRILDIVADEINTAKLLFRESPYALEDYIADWGNLYRTTTEKENGAVRTEWLKKENRESDFSLATAYFRVGLSKVLGISDGGGNSFAEPGGGMRAAPSAAIINGDGSMSAPDLDAQIKAALDNAESGQPFGGEVPDWRYG